VVSDELLYGPEYKYTTPQGLRPRFQDRARQLRWTYPNVKNLVEIGANNALFLHCLHDAGFSQVIGVDPSSKDPLVWKYPFNEETASLILRRVGTVDMVLANNVFAHIDDLDSVFRGVDAILSLQGVLIFEVQYLMSSVKGGYFDMFYHEHRDYHTIGPIAQYLKRHNMVMTDYEIIKEHGGSLRITAKRFGTEKKAPKEHIDWMELEHLIELEKAEINSLIDEKIPCFGAPAKATTYIYQMGLQDKISVCYDETPEKHGKYIGGTNIQVLPLPEILPHKMLLLSWNYEDIIKTRFPTVEFIVPYKEAFLC
jgi:methylation protein EvaC